MAEREQPLAAGEPGEDVQPVSAPPLSPQSSVLCPLLGLTTAELKALAEELGQPAYRGEQMAGWIYRRGAPDIDAMTDLPKSFRSRLRERHVVFSAAVHSRQVAGDGTTKLLVRLADGELVECVLIPMGKFWSVCLSSQGGCAVGCPFCATGMAGFRRHLTAGEIVEQFLLLQQVSAARIHDVVYMGMGEPLLNYEATLRSVRLLNQEVGVGMRHITVSTSGVIPAIRRLAEENLQLTLAVSLHTADPAKRDVLVPINRRWPIPELLQACRDYAADTRRRVTIEYVLLAGLNDSPADARLLARVLRGLHCHVNLIRYNATSSIYAPSSPAVTRAFAAVLRETGFPTTVRISKGENIRAACGQLRTDDLRRQGDKPGAA